MFLTLSAPAPREVSAASPRRVSTSIMLRGARDHGERPAVPCRLLQVARSRDGQLALRIDADQRKLGDRCKSSGKSLQILLLFVRELAGRSLGCVHPANLVTRNRSARNIG